ncbi:hypothetical protein [Caldithrix abyssi]
MPKRLTTIRLGEITDKQIKDFTDLGYTVTQLIAMAIDRFHHKELRNEQDSSLFAPIYSQIFHLCEAHEKDAVEVVRQDKVFHLCPINYNELKPDEAFYVEIGHLIRPPFTRVDFETSKTEDQKTGQRKFCRGMLVAAPSFSLA